MQEVMRLVLEAYYEPQFRTSSHGFRPNRGCHTALTEIHKNWIGTKWFIEGDLKACFDSLDHDVVVSIIGRKVKDERFLKLLRDMLKAGYMENWKYHVTYSGTPQGGVLTPPTQWKTFLKSLIKFPRVFSILRGFNSAITVIVILCIKF